MLKSGFLSFGQQEESLLELLVGGSAESHTHADEAGRDVQKGSLAKFIAHCPRSLERPRLGAFPSNILPISLWTACLHLVSLGLGVQDQWSHRLQ